MSETPHRIVNDPGLEPPVGFSHALAAGPGTTVYLGGQTGRRADGTIPDDLVEQFDQACANVVTALRSVGAGPEHLAQLQIFVTEVEAYTLSSEALGKVYQRHFGRHYPAAALLGVSRLFDAAADVEILAVAVLPGLT